MTQGNLISIKTVKLVIEPEESTETRAKELINQARQQVANELQLQELLQLIETILIYKLPSKRREEIEAMFSLDDLKQTRYFQDVMADAKRQAKLEAAPRFLALGLSVEQVAEALDLEVEVVRQLAEVHNDQPTEEV